MKPVLFSFHSNGILGLSQLEDQLEIVKLYKEQDPEATIHKYKEDVVAINCTVSNKISRKLIEALPKLQIIATFSIGYDHIDLQAAKDNNVVVTNTPDVLCAETANTGMALLLAVSKRLAEGDMYIRVGKWLAADMPLGVSLEGKTVGVVGLGGIGSKVAKRCEAFDMNVVYYGPREKKNYSYKYYSDIVEIAKDSDFLILTCPGVEATANLVDANVLDALGEKGFLINISRGSVVDEPTLIEALQTNRIAGAGLDVFANEPHVPEEYFSMDNVVLLPHIGSGTVETRTKMGQLVIDNILAQLGGTVVLTEVKVLGVYD